jgi:hypothetical protein
VRHRVDVKRRSWVGDGSRAGCDSGPSPRPLLKSSDVRDTKPSDPCESCG